MFSCDGAQKRHLFTYVFHIIKYYLFVIYSQHSKYCLNFIGWLIVCNMAIHLSLFGWLSGYMPLWLFFSGVFIISIPLAWYLTKEGFKPKDKWDWK